MFRDTSHDAYIYFLSHIHDEFAPRTFCSLSNAFTSAFKELDPSPQFRATAKLGSFLESRPGWTIERTATAGPAVRGRPMTLHHRTMPK